MPAENPIIARLRTAASGRSRNPAARGLRRLLRPLLDRRAGRAAMSAEVAGLRADLEHVRERHTEQIERLEDLVRELVLAAESLRRAGSRTSDRES
jgi:hypothetical protein